MDEIRRIRSVYKKREEQNKQVLYSLFQPGSLYIFQQRERVLLNELRKANLQELWSKKILDVGCGQGIELINFIRYGANPKNLFGIDLIRERIKSAESLSSYVNFSCGNATKLPYEDDCFDVVLQYTVFTSILDIEIKKKIANEMLRVLKKDGIILWYDYHVENPFNSDVKSVNKKQIFELFPECEIRMRRVTLAPPISRKLAKYSFGACYFLESLKIFNTHYFGAIKKK